MEYYYSIIALLRCKNTCFVNKMIRQAVHCHAPLRLLNWRLWWYASFLLVVFVPSNVQEFATYIHISNDEIECETSHHPSHSVHEAQRGFLVHCFKYTVGRPIHFNNKAASRHGQRVVLELKRGSFVH
jgi:hypothetical protein